MALDGVSCSCGLCNGGVDGGGVGCGRASRGAMGHSRINGEHN